VLKEGKLRAEGRLVPRTKSVAAAALHALAEPPPTSLRNGVLTVTPNGTSHGELAEVVYTLTQFPTVKRVEINGKRYTRADFEDVTPAILVESPLPGETVTSPLRATGTANTFEATFEYDLVDADGKVIAHHFVTATSGSGTRGTFDFTAPFHVDRPGPGKLVVYERSAENGARIHVSEIPLRLAP
jgi:germination protein M